MKIVAVEPIGMSDAQIRHYEEYFANMGHQLTVFPDRKEDAESLKLRMQGADVVIVSNIRLDEDILSACPQLKMISVAFTGIDHIDQNYCREHHITIYNAAGYATVAVAELTIALILDFYRKITVLDAETRAGGTRGQFLGQQIRGKKVGIIGTGAIGKETALLLQALGAEVCAWSRSESEELRQRGISYLPMEELLATADIISLHVPLTQETTHLLSAERLALCKPNAIIINTARGNVIDMPALAKALQDGKIAGAAIDVFEIEPPLPLSHPLLSAPNCIVVPHIGYATSEAFDIRIDIVMRNVVEWMKE